MFIKCFILIAFFSIKAFGINYDKVDKSYINLIKEEKQTAKNESESNLKSKVDKDNINSKKTPLESPQDNKKSIDFLFKTNPQENQFDRVSYGFIFLALICLIALYILKSRKRKNSIFNKFDQDMKIISTLPISTKRRIFLIDVKGQLMTLASTEHGIQFMTNIESHGEDHSKVKESSPKLFNSPYFNEDINTKKKSLTQDQASLNDSEIASEEKAKQKKTDLLSKALESLKKQQNLIQGKDFKLQSKASHHDETIVKSESEQSPLKILTKKRAFSKYLSDSFDEKNESEKKDEITLEKSDELDNITKMIKNRIRSMQSAS